MNPGYAAGAIQLPFGFVEWKNTSMVGVGNASTRTLMNAALIKTHQELSCTKSGAAHQGKIFRIFNSCIQFFEISDGTSAQFLQI